MSVLKAWQALQRPLSFAAKNNFQNIDKIEALGATLRKAAQGLAPCLQGEAARNLEDYQRRLQGFDQGSRSEQVRLVARGLRICALLKALSTEVDRKTSEAATAPALPPADEAPGVLSPVSVLRGVGPALSRRLAARGINTVEDLLYLLPLEYVDRRSVTPLDALQEGQHQTVEGTVVRISGRSTRQGRMLELGLAADPDQKPALHVIWFKTFPGLAEKYTRGQRLLVSGVLRQYRGRLQIPHPDFAEEAGGPEGAGIRARYPEVQGLAPARLATLLGQAMERFGDQIPDGVPAPLARELDLPQQAAALRTLHLMGPWPGDQELELLNSGEHEANRRLAFDEMFSLQLAVALRRCQWGEHRAPSCTPSPDQLNQFRQCFPFQLTGAQERVLDEVFRDMRRPRSMHRLLQGDVGSGKTVVAFGAAWAAMASGLQAAIMAPTEILAYQHLQVLEPWCHALGRRVALLTASTPRGVKESLLALSDAGQIDLLVGTHALLSQRLSLPNLALAVVDEQHRFGVMQRARLRDRDPEVGDFLPHLLVMTATPIPRSMALTVYGDLDLSVLDEKPPGRVPPRTRLFLGKQRDKAYQLVEEQLQQGQQAFVVCPLVEESDKLQVADVLSTAAHLQERFTDFRVGLVHGRMPSRQRGVVMDAFRRKELDLLVATTVIEVGIDVPDANAMVVEHAERFGLAQLHQLRGRVGRGSQRSLCLLLSDAPRSSVAGQRLAVMARTSDGFEIAEADLGIRGPGELVGTRQSGAPRFRFADLSRHLKLLTRARQCAQDLVERDSLFTRPENKQARQVMHRRWEHLPLVGAESG